MAGDTPIIKAGAKIEIVPASTPKSKTELAQKKLREDAATPVGNNGIANDFASDWE